MAFGSCITIKHGLLWDVKDRSPFKNSESPEFLFLNSIWKVQIDVVIERSTLDRIFQITLRNLCECQPPQPFEVTTFLEYKGTYVHMKCLNTTVTSGDAILYTVSLYALCKKIPGFDLVEDLTILIVFSASVELGLNIKKDFSSDVLGSNIEKNETCMSIVQCLIWESKMPRVDKQTSPVFFLLNSPWMLEIALTNSETAFHTAYQISLRCGNGAMVGCGVSTFPEVEVKTFLGHKDFIVQYRLSSRPDGASASFDTVHKARFENIYPDADGFEHCDDITVVSIFKPSTGLSLFVRPDADAPVLLECSFCQNRGCFVKGNLNQPPNIEFPFVQLLPNLPDLSEDLYRLLDKGFMSDVQLRCGQTVIRAHKAILAARSKLFNTKIKGRQSNLNSNLIIEVDDVELPLLQLLLRYIYSGMIPDCLSEEVIYRLFSISFTYKVESLQRMCLCYMVRNLREDNFVKYLVLALSQHHNDLKTAIFQYIKMNPELMNSESFIRFSNGFATVADEIRRAAT